MASQFDTLFDEIGRPALFEHVGETVTHRPLGVSANDASVTGVFEERETVRDTDKGRQVVRRGMLSVEDSLTIDVTDQWLIRGLLWQTADNFTAEAGLYVVEVTRVEDETRTGPRSVL